MTAARFCFLILIFKTIWYICPDETRNIMAKKRMDTLSEKRQIRTNAKRLSGITQAKEPTAQNKKTVKQKVAAGFFDPNKYDLWL